MLCTCQYVECLFDMMTILSDNREQKSTYIMKTAQSIIIASQRYKIIFNRITQVKLLIWHAFSDGKPTHITQSHTMTERNETLSLSFVFSLSFLLCICICMYVIKHIKHNSSLSDIMAKILKVTNANSQKPLV